MKEECEICSGKESKDDLIEKQKKMLKEYGWYAHYVYPSKGDVLVNYHTHGLVMDFQITLPISAEICHTLFHDVAKRMKNGEEFFDGKKDSELIMNFDVIYKLAKECDRTVMRIILPDEIGNLNSEKEMYAKQWEGTNGKK